MKILVFSDSHGEQRYMEKAVFEYAPDRIIHLGDRRRDAEKLELLFPEIPLWAVPGNCDLAATAPPVRVERCNGVTIFMAHGHLHGVKNGKLRLSLAAREAGAQLALCGHTHIPDYDRNGDFHMLNPGTAGGSSPTCGIVEITDAGEVLCRIVRL